MENDIELTRHQRYYAKNRESLIAKSKARRDLDPAAHNARALASKRKNWDAYLAGNIDGNRRGRSELKTKAITALGGRCVHCGYDADVRALQIDHVGSDGAIERKSSTNQWALYRSIVDKGAQGKYQALCANCNVIKRMDAGEHPKGRARQT